MSHTCETEQALQPNQQHENSQISDWKKEETEYVSARPQDKEPGILKYYKRGDYFLAGVTTEDTSAQKHDENEAKKKAAAEGVRQGTLLGVFFPVMQNILGVLLFIRVPAITGESGIRDSVLIVLVCCSTTFLTILSLSAIATNGKISTGGTYYILSRSLGAPIGTAVGFSFYLGTTFAGAMYILGAVESFIISTKLELGGSFQLSMRVYGTILLAIMIFLNIVGLKYVAKTGMVFLSVVLLAICGMYIGIFSQNARSTPSLPDIEDEYKGLDGITGMSSKNWSDNWGTAYDKNSFFILLSIYFPSVTGIMAGSNRSGDLADASYSIPRGTLGAQMITTVIYLSFPMLFGAVADRGTLQTEEYLIAAETSWPTKYLTIVAIILSSSGAGLQSLAGAPRLLLAVANDDNLPCFRCFKNNIRRIILFTGLICFGAVMIGDINVITPIITMFFLLCYGFVNLCCVFLDTVAFPNWRPTWRFYHRFLSLIGFCSCLFLMVAISWWSFLIALGLAGILFTIVVINKKPNHHYGDQIEAVKLSTAKSSLHGLINSSKHVKNWIPIVLVLGDYKPEKPRNKQIESEGALFFLNTIKKDISFVVYGTAVEGDFTIQDCKKVKEQQKAIEEWMDKEKLQVITKVVQVQKKEALSIPSNASEQEKQFLTEAYHKKPQQGILFLMQAAGLGGLEPNTLMIEFPQNFKADRFKAERFVQFVSYGVRFGKAIIATFNDEQFSRQVELQGSDDKSEPKRLKQETYTEPIDVWTFSYEQGLLILLTFFLSRSNAWKKCKVRLFIVSLQPKEVEKEEEKKRIKEKVLTFLERYRLASKGMEVEVELIEHDQWQQMEGYILTEGKSDQIKKNQELQNAPVDPQSNYGMNINEQPQQADSNRNGNNSLVPPAVKPERALSVMSHNQVSALNEKIQGKSRDSQLIIMNLPEPVNQKTADYLEYLKNMTNGLKRVLMIRNSQQECVTEFT